MERSIHARASAARNGLWGLSVTLLAAASALPAAAQITRDPFPDPIPATEGVIRVGYQELAQIPDFDGNPPRMMLLSDEPGTERLFVNDMWGVLYSVSYDGRNVIPYLDLTDPRWGMEVQTAFAERGFQSFAFHPQFAEQGTPGYGKFYTYVDLVDTSPDGDFDTPNDAVAHHTLLLEWTARDATSAQYDGGPPRKLIELVQPFLNHNGGLIAFNPTAAPGSPDYGLLYVGVADGGSGGDPMNSAQNLGRAFGKILRIDPLGSNSANGQYGVPADNPFVGQAGALGEIYAYGVRNPQRYGWDSENGNLYLADIGQDTVEELSPVPRGGNLGWHDWEGSFRFVNRQGVDTSDPRSDPDVVYPVAEYGQPDPLLLSSSAVTGVVVYRSDHIPQLTGKILFGDNPTGEVFYISADDLPDGGQAAIRRVLFMEGGEAKTLLQLVQEKSEEEGREAGPQADLRFGTGPDGRVFLLNKFDGTIRELTP